MRIRQLEIHGFKSFVDRTVFRFGEGVSGVVGPNGCGKSNVLDAINWVLGEQNPRTLRGQSMSDIIFNGSLKRPPVGLAEVSLTFTNERGAFPGAYAPLSEIEVSRLLYRSGESEYRINRIPCRLRDIQELFMDTGVGTRAYAIIEQGRIGQIVSAKPEQRRQMIEEAAGITRYKARRDEALRQLDKTQQNLERVSDVLGELARQMRSLERQARRARTYQTLKMDVRLTELVLALLRLEILTRALDEVNAGGRQLLDRQRSLVKKLDAASEQLNKTRARMGERGRRLGELKERLSRFEGQVALQENTLSMQGEQVDAASKRIDALEAEKAQLRAQQDGLVERRRTIIEERESLLRETEAFEAALAREISGQEGMSEARSTLSGEFERSKNAIIGHLTAVARLRNNLANLERREFELQNRLEKNREEEGRLNERLDALASTQEEVERRLEAQRDAREMARRAREDCEEGLKRLKGDVKRLEQSLSATRDDLASRRSRFQSLREIEQNLEGYGEGVRNLLRDYQGPGIRGAIADMLDVPKAYERAVEAVLGARLQYLVVGDASQALEALEFLEAIDGGRASLVPLNTVTVEAMGLPTGPRIGGPLLDQIRWRQAAEDSEGYAKVLESLLCGVVVVEGLRDALELRRKGSLCTFVTRDGAVLDPQGIVTGGSPDATGGILRKKGEMKELSADITRLERHREGLSGELERLRDEREGLVVELEALKEKLHNHDLEIIEGEKDLEQVTSDMARERSQLKLRGLDTRSFSAQLEELRRENKDAKRRLEEEEGARLLREDEIDAMEAQLREMTETMEKARERITGLHIRITEARSAYEEKGRALEQLSEEQRALVTRRKHLLKQVHGSNEELERLKQARATAVQALDVANAAVAETRGAMNAVSKEYGDARDALTEQEARVESLRTEQEKIAKEVGDTALKSKELTMQVDHVEAGIETLLDGPIDSLETLLEGPASELEAAAAERDPFDKITLGDGDEGAEDEEGEGGRPVLVLEAGVVARLRGALDEIRTEGFEAAEGRLEASSREARQKIARLGEVNLAAMEEFRALEERHAFTSAQAEDLRTSVASIKAAISRINRTSRQRFRTAFEAIDANFQTLFPKLFAGGSAKLVMTDESDLLETGVDIVVQPPGKKLQNINLLSGGEKAMAAVALIFAVFLVRPSPFCILDEVDAPLDEVNSGRFHEVIRELADQSQFIVITHNKLTMEIADSLYGVTMDEPGISRLVTVNLN